MGLTYVSSLDKNTQGRPFVFHFGVSFAYLIVVEISKSLYDSGRFYVRKGNAFVGKTFSAYTKHFHGLPLQVCGANPRLELRLKYKKSAAIFVLIYDVFFAQFSSDE